MESPRGSRESVRGGAARHVSVAEAVHRDGEAPPLTAASPEIGGIEEGGAGGVELRYEGVAAAGERGLEGPQVGREVGRAGAARHIGVAESVHRDAPTLITPATAKVRGVGEHRVNDQRPGLVIGGHLKRYLVRAFHHVAASDFAPHPINVLMDDGFVLTYGTAGRVHHELALGVYLQPLDAFEVEHDPLWVRSGCDDEVILELALVAVVDNVDAGID